MRVERLSVMMRMRLLLWWRCGRVRYCALKVRYLGVGRVVNLETKCVISTNTLTDRLSTLTHFYPHFLVIYTLTQFLTSAASQSAHGEFMHSTSQCSLSIHP